MLTLFSSAISLRGEMMSESLVEPITIKGNESAASVGELFTRSFNARERMARAGKVLGISWALAVVTLFIPIAHFVLVPLFGLGGPIMAVMKYRVDNVAEKAHGVCPECQQTVDIELDPADKLPKWTYCPSCNKPLQLMYHGGPTQAAAPRREVETEEK